MAAWIKRTEDGGIWLKRAPGTLMGMEGVFARGPVTFHPGDIDYPYWDNFLRELGDLPLGEKNGGEPNA